MHLLFKDESDWASVDALGVEDVVHRMVLHLVKVFAKFINGHVSAVRLEESPRGRWLERWHIGSYGIVVQLQQEVLTVRVQRVGLVVLDECVGALE